MITNSSETVILSNMGSVDKNRVWMLDLDSGTENFLDFGEAAYLDLQTGKEDYFAMVRHAEDHEKVEITAHHFQNPGKVLASAEVTDQSLVMRGESSVWQHLPPYYVAYIKRMSESNYFLIHIDRFRNNLELQTFDWFDDSYDHGYQGILSATQIPDNQSVIISIQRDSNPVIHDPESGKKLRTIPLANRRGNPEFEFLKARNELWASDYDTILKIRPGTWDILGVERIQEFSTSSHGTVRAFCGEFSFNHDASICAVARPFSGGVIGLNTENMKTEYRCDLGNNPLEVALLRDQRVFCRDWKTGKLLTGTLDRT